MTKKELESTNKELLKANESLHEKKASLSQENKLLKEQLSSEKNKNKQLTISKKELITELQVIKENRKIDADESIKLLNLLYTQEKLYDKLLYTYTLKAGKHRFNPFTPKLIINPIRITTFVKFDEIPPIDNYDDVSKLFGISLGFNHHKNSVRFGFKVEDGVIVLYTYVYNKGVRSITQIASLNYKRTYSLSMTFGNDEVLCFVNETLVHTEKIKIPKVCYQLNPYWGGDEVLKEDYSFKFYRRTINKPSLLFANKPTVTSLLIMGLLFASTILFYSIQPLVAFTSIIMFFIVILYFIFKDSWLKLRERLLK